MYVYVGTICESCHVSEENGHVEVDTEAKEQREERHTYSTVHQDGLLIVFISQPAPEVTITYTIYVRRCKSQ